MLSQTIYNLILDHTENLHLRKHPVGMFFALICLIHKALPSMHSHGIGKLA